MRMRIIGLMVATVLLAGMTGVAVGLSPDGGHGRAHPGMMSAMSMRASTSEAAWLREMVAHHAEAVAAARELARSPRPELRAFGEEVVRTQSAQVTRMRAWLAAWYPDEPAGTAYRPMMRDLTGLAGDDLDRAFLEDMVGHHMTAVMMSQHLLAAGTSTHPEVADLAVTIRDEQRAEIVTMRGWLRQWFGERAFPLHRP